MTTFVFYFASDIIDVISRYAFLTTEIEIFWSEAWPPVLYSALSEAVRQRKLSPTPDIMCFSGFSHLISKWHNLTLALWHQKGLLILWIRLFDLFTLINSLDPVGLRVSHAVNNGAFLVLADPASFPFFHSAKISQNGSFALTLFL